MTRPLVPNLFILRKDTGKVADNVGLKQPALSGLSNVPPRAPYANQSSPNPPNSQYRYWVWARSGVTEWHEELHIYTEIYVLQGVSQKPKVVAN